MDSSLKTVRSNRGQWAHMCKIQIGTPKGLLRNSIWVFLQVQKSIVFFNHLGLVFIWSCLLSFCSFCFLFGYLQREPSIWSQSRFLSRKRPLYLCFKLIGSFCSYRSRNYVKHKKQRLKTKEFQRKTYPKWQKTQCFPRYLQKDPLYLGALLACVASVSSGREENSFFYPRENRATAKKLSLHFFGLKLYRRRWSRIEHTCLWDSGRRV